ncbi:CD209 antigen-like protein E isoform X1 [Acanthopagrus latus]|uniref:CD209 antigen-like protein E isoform X1 n=1 Tax=Acanthopagrus latus TaxID=8177 RepID=UPI00187C36C0|nr:CD209 antigen-like protein E isoform X1 [Acanthopagrus latus]
MSSDIYAKPDLSKKVRYTRKEEWQENEVDIYESADDIGIHDFQSHDEGTQNEKQPPAGQRKRFSSAVFCLGVLCFLTLTAIIVLTTCYITINLGKDQLQNKYDKLSNNYTQLQETVSANNNQLKNSYETLSKNHSKLQDQVKKLKDEIKVNNSQLQDELQKLKDKIEEKWCPDGWTRCGCSCYFRSNEIKSWDQSRTDCRNKGADLVVINNRDENKFVSGLNNMYEEFWIGLKTEWSSERRSYEWKWVDGSPLTETFWAAGQSAATWGGYTAYSNQQGRWTQSVYYHKKYWICEKRVSCIL